MVRNGELGRSSSRITAQAAPAPHSSSSPSVQPSHQPAPQVSPPGASAPIRNPNGLLVRETQVIPESALNRATLQTEVAYLKKHVVIITFLAPPAAALEQQQWIPQLETKLRAPVELFRPAGESFYYIKFRSAAVTRVLHVTTCKLSIGTVLFQQWLPAFNPRWPIGLVIPTWIRLGSVPLEYLDMAKDMVSYVGPIWEADYSTGSNDDPRFCVAIDPAKGWVSTLLLPSG